LERRGELAEYATIAWNVMEMFVTIGLGLAARSLALVAFGMDSMVEVFASGVVVWHLRHPDRHGTAVTARALRLVAVAFFALAAVLTLAAAWVLLVAHTPDASPLGVAYLAVTALVMLALALVKNRTGRTLGSAPLTSEARMTFLDAALATSVLLGLVANAVFGWWWADPLATLLVAAASTFEGFANLRDAREMLATGGT
jgi:divalent metal cation (Fe/Co/Zn/Cd) transporter